jgi:hypothetical protein
MVKFWANFWLSFSNTFPMRGKLFQIFLDPDNFSKKLGFNFNLGPLKDLDVLIDSAKSYLRKQAKL